MNIIRIAIYSFRLLTIADAKALLEPLHSPKIAESVGRPKLPSYFSMNVY